MKIKERVIKMKVTIVNDWLMFHDTDNEIVNEYIEKHGLYKLIEKGKLQVNGTKEQLYTMLVEVTQEMDIELI